MASAASLASARRRRPASWARSLIARRIGAEAAFADRRLELVEILDVQLPVEERRGFGTDALQVEEVENRRRKLFQELLVICDQARLDQLADLRREILADAWYGEALCGREVRETLSGLGCRVSGVAVRANLERVVVLDLEKVADFGQDASDREVVH